MRQRQTLTERDRETEGREIRSQAPAAPDAETLGRDAHLAADVTAPLSADM